MIVRFLKKNHRSNIFIVWYVGISTVRRFKDRFDEKNNILTTFFWGTINFIIRKCAVPYRTVSYRMVPVRYFCWNFPRKNQNLNDCCIIPFRTYPSYVDTYAGNSLSRVAVIFKFNRQILMSLPCRRMTNDIRTYVPIRTSKINKLV